MEPYLVVGLLVVGLLVSDGLVLVLEGTPLQHLVGGPVLNEREGEGGEPRRSKSLPRGS